MPLIVLASGSPRRRELLKLTGWDFFLCPADADESRAAGERPAEYVGRVARAKALAAANICPPEGAGLMVAADTTVADGLLILGKPKDQADARRMLQDLRNRPHEVFTALAVYRAADEFWAFDVCRSQVIMRNYSDKEINAYISGGDPMDKAGAYAIQNKSFRPVSGFNGCFANVMGLPICHLVRTMQRIGISAPVDAARSCQRYLDYDCPVTLDILAGHDAG